MTPHRTAGVSRGVWYLRDPTGREVAAWLDSCDPRDPEQAACLVPRGAPLLDRRSLLSNVRLLVGLSGEACEVSDAVTALRTVEIPDHLLRIRAGRLSQAQRLAAWLAICRLRVDRTIVLIEPFLGLSGVDTVPLARLIRETASAADRTILLVSVDATVGQACFASPVLDLRNSSW